jgi:hypothetical protein
MRQSLLFLSMAGSIPARLGAICRVNSVMFSVYQLPGRTRTSTTLRPPDFKSPDPPRDCITAITYAQEVAVAARFESRKNALRVLGSQRSRARDARSTGRKP